ILGYPHEYRGKEPFSERETKAVKAFIENRSIIIAIDFHTGAEEVIFYPFGYTNEKQPEDIKTFLSIAQNISSINRYKYMEAGEGVIGMAIDWMYEKHRIYAMIIELCGSVAPTDENTIREIFSTNLPVLYYLIERVIEWYHSPTKHK
ncbi:MAG: hypothetical protein J7L58_07590, partial [Thermoplasmata archaeon]|nr:hypothetical protein [Thermoplasmata archaeon]